SEDVSLCHFDRAPGATVPCATLYPSASGCFAGCSSSRRRVWSPARNSGRSANVTCTIERLTANNRFPSPKPKLMNLPWALSLNQVHLLLALRLLSGQVRQLIQRIEIGPRRSHDDVRIRSMS